MIEMIIAICSKFSSTGSCFVSMACLFNCCESSYKEVSNLFSLLYFLFYLLPNPPKVVFIGHI